MVFQYGEQETAYLKKRDKRLGAVIDRLGHLERPVQPDLFAALAESIVGQQISTKAQLTICARLRALLGTITPETIAAAPENALKECGMSFRKVAYLQNAARQVLSGALDLAALRTLPDEEVCRRLVALDGIGVWTAEMLMTFSMQRPDIVSFGDLAILRGMRMLYRHREIDRARFERYRRRFSPYGTVASLYLWAVSNGALPELDDPARPKTPTQRGKSAL